MAESPEDIKKKLLETSEIVENTLKSIAANISDIFQDALSEADTITKILGKDIEKQLKSLARSTDKMVENQLRINKGQVSARNIDKQILEYNTKQEILQKRINNLSKEQPEIAARLQEQLDDVSKANKDYIAGLEEQKILVKEIEDKTGVLGKTIKGISKIPVLGNLIDSQEVLEDIYEEAAKKGSTTTSVLKKGFVSLGQSIGKNLLDPLTKVTFILKEGLNADKQLTELRRNLVVSRFEAYQIREQFVEYGRSVNDTFITTNRLIEANAKLSEQLGINKIFSMDINKEFATLTDRIGITEEAAAGLAKITVATGQPARLITTQAIAAVEKVKQETGLRLNNKKILEATGKVSGQLLANFKANPAAIAEAVAQAEALGTSLERTSTQAQSLLNWESSIENELKAELITGKQINLERARAAALVGDQATLMKELAAQAVDFNTFSNMNVIAQQSLAEALGLSANELADQLMQQQFLGKSKEEILALGGEEALQRMEALTAQQKFNNAVDKLKDLLGNLVAGPLGSFLNVLSDVLQVVNLIAAPLRFIGDLVNSILGPTSAWGSILKGILFTAIGIAAFTNPLAALGGLAIAGAAVLGMEQLTGQQSFKSVKDGYIDPADGTVILSEAGNFQTRPDDKMLIGTNIAAPTAPTLAPSIDFTPMITAINEVKEAINKMSVRPAVAYINGRDAFANELGRTPGLGTSQNQSSYNLA